MPAFTRGVAPELYEVRSATLFFKEYDAEPLYYPMVFNVEPSTKAFEDWFEVAGMGTFRLKPEGSPIQYDVPVQGPKRRVVHSTFALGGSATFEAIDDEQYDVLDQIPRDLGAAAREHQDIFAWDLFNGSFGTTTYTTPDGLAICSTTHTILKPKDPAVATNSNQVSPGVAISVTGIESAMTLLRLTKTREDRFTNLRGKYLVAHPANEHRVYELLNTERKVDGNENNMSTVATSRTGIEPVLVPYLDSQDDWWLVAEKGKHKLTFNSRQDIRFDSGKDYQTKNVMFDAMYRASLAAKDYRGIVGSDA